MKHSLVSRVEGEQTSTVTPKRRLDLVNCLLFDMRLILIGTAVIGPQLI
jgi:hypothetical protein